MNQVPLAVLVGVVAAAMMSCSREANPEPRDLAQRAIILLQRGDYVTVAKLLDEPPSYGEAELTRERQALTVSLAYLFGEFGSPLDVRVADARLVFYKFSIAGADIPYWKSLPNLGIDDTLTFAVHFDKVGPGVLAFTFIRRARGWEVRSIEPGLLVDAPQARDTMLRIGRGFLKQTSHLDEATITRLLQKMFPQSPGTKPAESSA